MSIKIKIQVWYKLEFKWIKNGMSSSRSNEFAHPGPFPLKSEPRHYDYQKYLKELRIDKDVEKYENPDDIEEY